MSRDVGTSEPTGIAWFVDTARKGVRGFSAFRRTVMWGALVRQKWWLLGLALTTTLGTGLAAQTLSALRSFFDDAVLRKNPETVITVSQGVQRLVVLAIASAIVGIAGAVLFARVRFHLEYELRGLLYRSLHTVDPRALDTVASGQLVTRSLADLQLFMAFIGLVPAFVLGLIPLFGFTVYFLLQDVPLTILAMSTWVINIYLVKRMSRRTWGLSFQVLNRYANVTTRFDEAVRGIRVVKAFGREDDERRRVAEAAGEAYGASMTRTRLVARFDILLKGAPLIVGTLLLLFGARWVQWEWLTVGQFVVFIGGTRSMARFASGLDEIVSGYYFAKTGAGRILELMGALGAGEIPPPPTGDPAPEASSGLSLRGVSVAYEGIEVVSDLDIEVSYGSLVVVAGPPRSGRSTIADLTVGAVSPSEGDVLLDGVDVSTVHPSELRKTVRVVSEHEFLFARSVRENLEFGAQSMGVTVTADKLRAALTAAAADDVVDELEGGLDAVLGDRALTLSGGQRQRLALARALVVPPRVLVLDDALMSVHPSLEVEILRRIRAHAPDTAILCLTRRDAAEAVADRVVRLPAPQANRPVPPPPALAHDAPYDLRLLDILNFELPPDTERPEVPEEVCRESDRPPGVRSALSPVKGPLTIAAILVLFFSLGGSLVPDWLFGRAVDAVETERFGDSDEMAMALLGFGVAWAFIAWALAIYRRKVEETIMYVLRRRVFQRITRLGVDYYDRELPGQMATRVAEDVRRVGRFVDGSVYRTATALVTLVSVFAVMTIWEPSVGLIGMAFAPILLLLSAANIPLARRMFEWARRELGSVMERLQEDFNGRQTLMSFGVRTRAFEGFMERAQRLKMANIWAALVSSGYSQVVELTVRLAGAAILWRAGTLAVDDILTVGAVTTLSLYIDDALEPIPRLANVLQDYMESRASIRKLREPFEAAINPPEDPSAVPTPPLGGGIDLDGVSFRYPGTERVVLDAIDLHLEPGQMLALVGPTGAGKSSVAKLVGRIYDPVDGEVRVDDTDIREFQYDTYRQRFGIVPQETFCFRGTVGSNVAYARPGASLEEMEKAAKAVGADTVLASLPGGMSALVHEDGRNLTAAQKQLIALTRAVLADPDILVLDEATATLDPETEQRVVASLRKLRKTMVVVTHRLPVAKQADVVAVIDGGRVVEVGTHAQLMKKRGPYSSLWAYGAEVGKRAMATARRKASRTTKREATPAARNGARDKAKSAANGRRAAAGKAVRTARKPVAATSETTNGATARRSNGATSRRSNGAVAKRAGGAQTGRPAGGRKTAARGKTESPKKTKRG